MTETKLRPPAVPLVTVDPNFSIWSVADALHQDKTRHWTLTPHELVGLIRIDGRVLRFMGSTNPGPSWRNARQPSGIRQIEVSVNPTTTVYRFEDGGIRLSVFFISPLLPDDLDLLSRPFSYIIMRVDSVDGRTHQVQLYLDGAPNICSSANNIALVWDRAQIADGWISMRVGTWQQNVLGQRGDLTTINWGYFHLIVPDSTSSCLGDPAHTRLHFQTEGTLAERDLPCPLRGTSMDSGAPYAAACSDLGSVSPDSPKGYSAIFGYDDVASIDYFGIQTRAYCFRSGVSFKKVAERAATDFPSIIAACRRFDEELRSRAEKNGGRKYADLICLAYRQSVAAHKLIADESGHPVFLSKECTSNGSVGTVDVSYPSSPLYSLLAPELVAGMLRPIFRFAASDAWPVQYAPHDVGTYPRANGQTYGVQLGIIDFAKQMPVEECGNMLIMSTVYIDRDGSTALVEENWELLTKWADYLTEHGLDPEHQLCTDDFAGHLARNANLSIKAIIGIACYARLCSVTHRSSESDRYLNIARDFAESWLSMADDGDWYRLSFDAPGTWSLKYNLVWDTYFGFGLFPALVAQKEIAKYLSVMDRYGTPLDSRAPFTKTDWLVWAASLSTDPEARSSIVSRVWDFANETPDRTPFSDWYDTHDAREQSFHNRTVIGGIFMPLLLDCRKQHCS